MRTALRYFRNFLIVVAPLIAGLWFFGPREPIDTRVTFHEAMIEDDLEAYLKETEGDFGDITPGTEKRIIWGGAKGEKTGLAFIYLHGWGASSEEIRPVPDQVAEHFGANLFFTRVKGHGRSSNPFAMSEPTMNDWIQDFAEAMEVGRRLGERVILLTTSTGGSLAMAGAAMPEFKNDIAGLVLISPNFGPRDPMAGLANWPLARYWVPALVGEWREWEPHNELQGKYWTTRTQNVAALPMMALVKHVGELDLPSIKTPALFIYSKADSVVSTELTDAAFEKWGGPKQREIRVMTDQDSPSHHVIAGDIMSPNQTAETTAIINAWIAGL